AIYRSGNLQNVISIDPLSIETAEVIFGPGSLTYGSDAIGGVMDFHTLEPRFSSNNKAIIKGSALTRYSTANNEKTVHADMNIGWQKWSLLSSVSYSKFDDLKMGKMGGQDSYLRPEYVERQNNTDVIVPNSNPRIQRFSGYDQWNFLQKLRCRPSEKWDMQYSFTYAGTGEAPRYDRLIQYRNGALRFAEWNYGPMLWRMHNLQVMQSQKTALYDEMRITMAYQDYEESRIDRTRNNNNRHIQTEKVDAVSVNLDATKKINKTELFYGFEQIYNKVGSFGEQVNITNNTISPYVTRYPNGSTWTSSAIYSSAKFNFHPKFTVNTGLRYSYNTISAKFDPSFIPFPYDDANLHEGALTGNAGLVYRPDESWQLNGNISTGYRMPNVDDLGKLFESVPGNITVPNPNLTPEYAWNFEAGIVKTIDNEFRVELNGFYTILDNAIVRRPSSFNGQDSILFDGILSRVEQLQNVAHAKVYGIQSAIQINLTKNLLLKSFANWINGKETDDVNDVQVPLRHAPPFYGNTLLQYRFNNLMIEASSVYNSRINNKDLAPSEQGKTDIYAKDGEGKSYSPAWYTLNVKASYRVCQNLSFHTGWENITNQRYRPYSSGIVAAGSNFIISLRTAF
ncbi:MAG TPA: TonB-dependent receptor, partial [Chitinophagaceae bacterium]|nr:TonB-dependent receptor [Chitinophagaceae bacterium]